MRLGIDFGTTHTVAALVDRGNYPVVSYEWGDSVPSLVAVRASDGALKLGLDALPVLDDPGWTVVRSIKRLLADAGPLTEIEVGARSLPLLDVLVAYLERLREDIVTRSNAGIGRNETLEVAVSVPANASNDQRFLTLEAFRRAGFEVLALLNEPSAAGFEYAHRFRSTVTSKREYVLVYDLGGGTFDSSLIHMAGRVNEVITTAGVARLGGDDLDEASSKASSTAWASRTSTPTPGGASSTSAGARRKGSGPTRGASWWTWSCWAAPPWCCRWRTCTRPARR
jgi:molecular chaperone DnaK (HSP70)